MKRINLTVLTVFILIISLSICTIDCSAAEAYFTDLVDAELTSHERIDYYNEMLKTEGIKAYLNEINAYENVFAALSYDEGRLQVCDLTFYCFNDDYVAFLYAPNGAPFINFISKSNQEIIGKFYRFQASFTNLNADGSLNAVLQGQPSNFSLGQIMVKNDITYYKRDYWSGVTAYSTSNDGKSGVVRSDVPIFNSENDAILYLEGNDIKPLYSNSVEPKDYSGELYFKSFDVIPHVSNSAEYYYFDIKYELSDYAKKNIDKLNLNFENLYRWETANSFDSLATYKQTGWLSNSIDLSKHPYGFEIRIEELGCYRYAVDHWNMLPTTFVGNNVFFDISNSVIHTLLPNLDFIEISQAYLYFRFNLRFNSDNGVIAGKRNDFTYDILNKKIEKSIYIPNTTTNSDGSTTFVKDGNGNITYTQEGDKVSSNDYYYNNVTDDGNKYFYYDKDGNGKEISEDVYTNSSANASIGDININIGDSSGEYISISPVDFNKFIKGFEEVLKAFDVKGGLFQLLQGTFSLFPEKVNNIMVGAISAIVIVSVICILRRR